MRAFHDLLIGRVCGAAQVLGEVATFMLVLLILVLGFAVGLSIIVHGNHGDFGDPRRALFSTFNYGLYSEFGDFFEAFADRGGSAAAGGVGGSGAELNWVAAGLFHMMMGLVQIISLNLLIAMMNDSYENVRQHSVLEARREQVVAFEPLPSLR